jgi:hypothetical protein
MSTPNLKIKNNPNNKVNKMSIKELAKKSITKKVPFMGEKVSIKKLSVSEVMEIQDLAKDIGEDESKGFEILKHVIVVATEGAEDLSDQDFDSFPMEELSKLSDEIMKFSGMGEKGK